MKALVIVGMQEDYVGDSRNRSMFNYDSKTLIRNINHRISTYDSQYVIYIKDTKKNGLLTKFISNRVVENTPGNELVKGLNVVSENIFKTYKTNPFTNRDLYNYIEEKQITELEIVGVDGGSCVGQTALGAKDIGYEVTINKKCVGTVLTKQAKLMEAGLSGSGVKYI